MIATAAAHGHAEQAVLVHATTPAQAHAWQAAQEAVPVAQVHAREAVQAVQEVAEEHALPVAAVPAVAVTAGHIK